MARENNIWKFNDDEWKVHITSEQLKEEVLKNFNLRNSTTTYYESGTFEKFHGQDCTIVSWYH